MCAVQVLLGEDDVIVEFMHIHWGLKANNPVSRVRLVYNCGTSSSAIFDSTISFFNKRK